jgi:hypothetical protein
MTGVYLDKSELRGIESAKKSIAQAIEQIKVTPWDSPKISKCR